MDETYGLLTALLLIVLVVWTVFRVLSFRKHTDRRFPRVLLSDLCPLPEDDAVARKNGPAGPKLKSGDILLYVVRCRNLITSFLSLDLFSHAGVIVEDRTGRLFLSEANDGGELAPAARNSQVATRLTKTAAPYRLLARLKHYAGSFFVLRLNRPLDAARLERLQYLAFTAEGAAYPSFVQGAAAIFGLRKAMASRPARHCTEHVAWLVDGTGLTPLALASKGKTLLQTGFFKSSLAVSHLAGTELPDGYEYLELVQILYDLDVQEAERKSNNVVLPKLAAGPRDNPGRRLPGADA